MEQFIAFFGSRPFKPQLFSEKKKALHVNQHRYESSVLDLDLKPLLIVRNSLSLPPSFVHFSPVGIMQKCFRLRNIYLYLGPVAQCTNTSNKRVLRLFIFFPSSILNNYFRCSFSQSYIFGVTRIQLIAPPLIDSLCAAD